MFPCGRRVRLTTRAQPRAVRPALRLSAAGCCYSRRPVACYAGSMTIKARVRGGHLVVDEPINLPEGTELELLPLDPGDWLDEADRAALHAALAQSEADVAAGRLGGATEGLKRLRLHCQSDAPA